MPKRTRRQISNSQKAALRAQHHLNPHLSNLQLQKCFEEQYKQPINPSSVSRILSTQFAFLDTLEPHLLSNARRRTETWPELENALFEWIKRAESQTTISQEVMREKARQFWPLIYPEKEMPQFSNGWLHGFQSRRNIRRHTQHREAGSLSKDAAGEMLGIRQTLSTYAPQDIFNCDETGLYWKRIPDSSPSTQAIPGRTKEKARISALFCCNSDASERLPIWFIGCAKRPRAFTAAGIDPENLGCKWRSNKKAWVTRDIFKEWLFWFDERMSGRKVVLLMDHFSAHEAAYAEIGQQLQNTLIIWLPANSTSRYQPLEGIIRSWKAYWKRQWIFYMMAEFDRGFNPISTMTILRALRWAIPAWNIDLKHDTIRQCFKNALTTEDSKEINENELMNEIQQGLQKLELSNNIQEAMSTGQFLDPADEQVNDDLVDLDDMIIGQFAPENCESDAADDDAWEPLPQISPADALECLYKLRLFEEQQVDADQRLIQHLMRHERVLLRKKIEKQQQADVRMFFS